MAIEKKKVTISVMISPDDRDRLKSLADSQERSISQMAAIFIREGLDKVQTVASKGDAA
jgi:CopG-like RHH_1 or ribbon-helix-helix domain, RHH_5